MIGCVPPVAPTTRIKPDAIGNTPLVERGGSVPRLRAHRGQAGVVQPLRSMKTGAKAMIEAAAWTGALRPGGTVVANTAGTTGISLALVATAMDTVPTLFPRTRSARKSWITMRAYGAELTLVPSDQEEDHREAHQDHDLHAAGIGRLSRPLAVEPSSRIGPADAGYEPLGEEMHRQSGGIDALVHCVAPPTRSRARRARPARTKSQSEGVAVEPSESAVLLRKALGAKSHRGIGSDHPPLWRPERWTISRPSRRGGRGDARRLAPQEGIFVAFGGGNVVVAPPRGEAARPGATVGNDLVDPDYVT